MWVPAVVTVLAALLDRLTFIDGVFGNDIAA
jgi:hypothetical protein